MLPKIDVPVYETKLISNGKTIKYRPFLVKEQKIFLMASQSEDVKDMINAIKQVLKNCVLNDDVDIDSLPVFDLEYLFLQLRARSVNEVVNLKYTCNNPVKDDAGNEKPCGGSVSVDVNILEIEPTKNPEHDNKISLSENLGICMKYPTFEILEKLNSKEDVDFLSVIASCIDYIYDKENVYYAKDADPAELNEFIESMQQADVEKIQTFFETMPKITKDFDFKCKKCGYEEHIEIEGMQSFFV